MADAFGSSLHGEERRGEETEVWVIVLLTLSSPRLREGLSIFLCVFLWVHFFCLCVFCQGRRVRRWSWRMWSSISASVCHASRTTAPFLSSLLTARASSCPTASTPRWEGHWLFFNNSLFVSQQDLEECCHSLEGCLSSLSLWTFSGFKNIDCDACRSWKDLITDVCFSGAHTPSELSQLTGNTL